MALELPKENATQEEINAWIIATQEKYNKMEVDIETKTNREKELLTENNKLFSKITGKAEDKEDKKKEIDIPFCLDKETFEKLSEKDIKELNELLKGEDD